MHLPITRPIYVGQMWIKLASGRQAQVSALDDEYVYLYWPDRDTCTAFRKRRLISKPCEWKPG